jgi:hypothetical protein
MDMPMTLLLDVPSQAVGKNNFTSGSTFTMITWMPINIQQVFSKTKNKFS